MTTICMVLLEQQKLIEDLKFQQSQVAFKEQMTLLEQIKTKQVLKHVTFAWHFIFAKVFVNKNN